MQQFSVQIGQCVDKDQTTSPNLLVRSSSYGDSVVAGEEFTLSLGVYATAGNEPLSDVIVSLTLPENVSLSNGSLSFYLGSLQPETMQTVSFPVLPASGFHRHRGQHHGQPGGVPWGGVRQGRHRHHRHLGAGQPARPLRGRPAGKSATRSTWATPAPSA